MPRQSNAGWTDEYRCVVTDEKRAVSFDAAIRQDTVFDGLVMWAQGGPVAPRGSGRLPILEVARQDRCWIPLGQEADIARRADRRCVLHPGKQIGIRNAAEAGIISMITGVN